MDRNPHASSMSEAEMDAAIEAIVRRAMADLRALGRGCDCSLLYATRVMLALALDERVIGEEDAGVAIDLVEYLGHAQATRRLGAGLDEVTVDGPLVETAKGRLVGRVNVCLRGRWVPVADALRVINTTDG